MEVQLRHCQGVPNARGINLENDNKELFVMSCYLFLIFQMPVIGHRSIWDGGHVPPIFMKG